MAAPPASIVQKPGAPQLRAKGAAVPSEAPDPFDATGIPLPAGVLDGDLSLDETAGDAAPVEIHPDVLLVERAKAGDTAAFEQLVKQYDRQIFRTAQHITQNREDAEDITQDVFFKAFQKLDQFQGNSKFSTWLVRIAVNESLMRLRKRKTSRTVSMDQDVETDEGSIPRDFAEWRPNPEQNYSQSELAEILRKTIAGLPPGFRTVFTLRDIENLSTEETAEALGLSVPAVKSRLLRARLQLRERLSRYFRQSKEATGDAMRKLK
jgi:RNA polymerase sigma-70 factor (ECF subfamily)